MLREDSYKNVETERFEHSADLCAAILLRGISLQIKQGLHREYVQYQDPLATIQGQVDIGKSVLSARLHKKLVCTYDEYSEDNRFNQIIKATSRLLISSPIDKERKALLKKSLVYFANVGDIDLRNINWNFQFNRYNKNYRMLIAVCFLVCKGLLQTNSKGQTYLMDFLDEQRMSHLYEKFLLEYYKHHWGKTIKVTSPKIAWQLDESCDVKQLPTMKSDIVISLGDNYLIIDAKYYSKILQTHLDKDSIRSAHLYQMFAYVKNLEAQLAETRQNYSVSGLLMYAMTDDEKDRPHLAFKNLGNWFFARSIDLNAEWSTIRQQLDSVIVEFIERTKS